MRIMVCEVRLSGQLVGVYPDPQNRELQVSFLERGCCGLSGKSPRFFHEFIWD